MEVRTKDDVMGARRALQESTRVHRPLVWVRCLERQLTYQITTEQREWISRRLREWKRDVEWYLAKKDMARPPVFSPSKPLVAGDRVCFKASHRRNQIGTLDVSGDQIPVYAVRDAGVLKVEGTLLIVMWDDSSIERVDSAVMCRVDSFEATDEAIQQARHRSWVVEDQETRARTVRRVDCRRRYREGCARMTRRFDAKQRLKAGFYRGHSFRSR